LLPTLPEAASQSVPLFKDTNTVSPAARLALRLPLMVWDAVLVMKSLPLSTLKAALAILVVGAWVSTTGSAVLSMLGIFPSLAL
jgi:hypothetical protein